MKGAYVSANPCPNYRDPGTQIVGFIDHVMAKKFSPKKGVWASDMRSVSSGMPGSPKASGGQGKIFERFRATFFSY